MKQLTTLYVNADVLTMDREVPRVEAFLVREGRVAALGPRRAVEDQAPANVRRIDLQGGTVIPGFNDCHCHILSFGLSLDQIDLSPDAVSSIGDVKTALVREVERLPAGEWVRGRGYNQNALQDGRHPTRHDLDEVAPNHPVVIWHASGHTLVCNSQALALAGVGPQTDTPAGGEIDRDEHGEPTGVLKEAAMDLLNGAMPEPTVEQGAEAIIRAMDVMASQGITSATDANTSERELPMYLAALHSGRLAGRITLMPAIELVAPPGEDKARPVEEFSLGDQPEWLRIGATKIFSDGALTTRTAAVSVPFDGEPENLGLFMWQPDELRDMIRRAHDAGWQIATHAIGDRAVQLVLDCYEAALQAAPREDHRHRIEHCMMLEPQQALRMQQLGVVAVLQPGFIGRLGDAYITVLGAERAAQLNPMERFDMLGIPVAFSSDRPVIPGAPLKGIRSAMQRLSPQGVVLGREHAITALQAIRYYTSGAAFASRTDDFSGTLVRDKVADFTVLSRNPAETAAEDFGRVRVERTVVGGIETFE